MGGNSRWSGRGAVPRLHWALPAAAMAGVVVAALGACGFHAGSGNGLGPIVQPTVTVTASAPPAPAPPATGGTTTPRPPATGHPRTHPPSSRPAPPAGPPPGGQPPAGGGSSSPAIDPGAGGMFGSDYYLSVKYCFYRLDPDSQFIQVGAVWWLGYHGMFAPEFPSLPFQLTNNRDSATDQGQMFTNAEAYKFVGDDPYATSPYLGHTVTLTLSIYPSGQDNNASDNLIRTSIAVPSDLPPANTTATLPCGK